jgi:hypothetical protein
MKMLSVFLSVAGRALALFLAFFLRVPPAPAIMNLLTSVLAIDVGSVVIYDHREQVSHIDADKIFLDD